MESILTARLTILRFADDVALMTEDTTQMEEQLNMFNTTSKEVELKCTKEKINTRRTSRPQTKSKSKTKKPKKYKVTSTLDKQLSSRTPAKRKLPAESEQDEAVLGKTEKFSWTTKCRSR
ncbi:hypothetical protein ElyMa_005034500 [Elysia marginata]|uniref:Reverse transcriptase domain-containing protein n=1 Tax=Elysia marginata TaxID=1093978 RepID=A0AAV4JAX3_9GAST|nr:hypothetical protein ElyMa_005034500 [Elysia marginata]